MRNLEILWALHRLGIVESKQSCSTSTFCGQKHSHATFYCQPQNFLTLSASATPVKPRGAFAWSCNWAPFPNAQGSGTSFKQVWTRMPCSESVPVKKKKKCTNSLTNTHIFHLLNTHSNSSHSVILLLTYVNTRLLVHHPMHSLSRLLLDLFVDLSSVDNYCFGAVCLDKGLPPRVEVGIRAVCRLP